MRNAAPAFSAVWTFTPEEKERDRQLLAATPQLLYVGFRNAPLSAGLGDVQGNDVEVVIRLQGIPSTLASAARLPLALPPDQRSPHVDLNNVV